MEVPHSKLTTGFGLVCAILGIIELIQNALFRARLPQDYYLTNQIALGVLVLGCFGVLIGSALRSLEARLARLERGA